VPKRQKSRAIARRSISTDAVRKIISSKILGRLRLHMLHIAAIEEDFVHYESSVLSRQHGRLSIVLNSDDDVPDWHATAKYAEVALPALLKKELRLRRAAIPAIRRLRDRCFKWDKWRGTNAELMTGMKLYQINFTDDRAVEMWYAGGKRCHSLAVRLTLGPRLGLRKVGFDG